jgi:hypothetical protein
VSFTTRDASIAETVRTLLSNWTTDATPLMREMGDLGVSFIHSRESFVVSSESFIA